MHVLWPGLAAYTDWALLAMRLVVATVFVRSGWNHATDPVARGKSIGASPAFARVLGIAEIAGGLGVALGILIQPAAIGLILVMLGAIGKKIFVWKTGFWGEKASGWHYDLMLAVTNLVILTTGGGRLVVI
jgi:putative oxidoreductase